MTMDAEIAAATSLLLCAFAYYNYNYAYVHEKKVIKKKWRKRRWWMTSIHRNRTRMIIFSNSSILACPDKKELQQVHIIFNKMGDNYDKLVSLFLKFSLVHDGVIKTPSPEDYQMCFTYTLTAKLAPLWNTLGQCYLINNRDFLTCRGPQDGVKYNIWSNDAETVVELKPIKINFITPDEKFYPGEWIRVLPSLNKAIVEDFYESIPESANFKCYKDLRRHWKNIHGYRLPEEEGNYITVRFWRGEPLTYPKICVARNFPIVTPVPKHLEKTILKNFISSMKSRMPHFLGMPLSIECNDEDMLRTQNDRKLPETQAISLCTPTQR